jgi:hypothetical protein
MTQQTAWEVGCPVVTPDGRARYARHVEHAVPARVVVTRASGAEQTYLASAVRRDLVSIHLGGCGWAAWFCDAHRAGTVTWEGDVARCDVCGARSDDDSGGQP